MFFLFFMISLLVFFYVYRYVVNIFMVPWPGSGLLIDFLLITLFLLVIVPLVYVTARQWESWARRR
ncbi:hypothetical protein B0H94_10215 [Salsuginibacillus halophilus]|uniref:Uncharacterized protein n=1 Tax=Salsuginibacillus halophilus TaxID=517424 RepID=A0A2P8HWX1_9BACI|nr:hypothetical protein B0H94_10215 [Salsuginibacillus halophilus]